MNMTGQHVDFFLLLISIHTLHASRLFGDYSTKRITVEKGSDLSLSCTFQSGVREEMIVQWLYQNTTDRFPYEPKTHWRPLFLNSQSLTPSEIRHSIRQKVEQINQTTLALSTIFTLTKVTDSDEGLYMCKSLLSSTMHIAYQVRVIESLDIYPKQLVIPADESGQYSIRLNCIVTDLQTGRRHHDISWWHNNRRLGSQTSRYARIVRNFTQNSFISTLFYTGEPENIVGHYVCESEPLRRSISVKLESNTAGQFPKDFLLLMFPLLSSWIVMS